MRPAYFAVSDDGRATGPMLAFCDEECRDRYQAIVPFPRLASGDSETDDRCATCGEEPK